MKKLFLILTLAFAIMTEAQENKQPIPQISVSGEGKIKVKPDQVAINFGVENTGNRGRKGNGQKGGNKQQYKDKAITESKEKRQERKEENKQEAQKERAKDKALEKVKERKEAAEEETEETKKQKAKEKAREKVKEKKNAASTQGSN